VAVHSNWKILNVSYNYLHPKFTHTTPLLKSLHWLKINERIQYKILYLTFKLLYTT